jgi:hypothetical protein
VKYESLKLVQAAIADATKAIEIDKGYAKVFLIEFLLADSQKGLLSERKCSIGSWKA